MSNAQSQNKGKSLTFFVGINSLLMIANTSFVTSKELMTVLACLIGPVSWGLAWYLERWLILNAPNSLEEAQFERANKELIADTKKMLKDKKISADNRALYESILSEAYLKKNQLLQKRQDIAYKKASANNLTTAVPNTD